MVLREGLINREIREIRELCEGRINLFAQGFRVFGVFRGSLLLNSYVRRPLKHALALLTAQVTQDLIRRDYRGAHVSHPRGAASATGNTVRHDGTRI